LRRTFSPIKLRNSYQSTLPPVLLNMSVAVICTNGEMVCVCAVSGGTKGVACFWLEGTLLLRLAFLHQHEPELVLPGPFLGLEAANGFRHVGMRDFLARHDVARGLDVSLCSSCGTGDETYATCVP
jgi:hypothetical protein